MPEKFLLGDAHTHLDQYPHAELPQILERAAAAGVGFIVCAGTTLESTRACIRLSQEHQLFYAGVGIHPMEAHQRVAQAAYDQLESLAKDNEKVVCISEVGLDYLPDSPDHDIQDQVFRQHIRLAKSLKLPIIFHSGSRIRRSFGFSARRAPAMSGAPCTTSRATKPRPAKPSIAASTSPWRGH